MQKNVASLMLLNMGKKDKNIIIKDADKDNAIILMDRDYYKRLCPSILKNEVYYKKQTNYQSKYYGQTE